MTHNILSARQLQICRCTLCGLVCQDMPVSGRTGKCPRCHTLLPYRQSGSWQTSLALLISAMILYVPANVLPVMHTMLAGQASDSTILSGIRIFWLSGSPGIATLIFIASVVVPCIKFLSLGLLLYASARKIGRAGRERSRLWRLTEWIGCWSMLDVVVVAVVSALLRFPLMSEAEPRSGILFFGMVVILTMLSALAFEPKSIWENHS